MTLTLSQMKHLLIEIKQTLEGAVCVGIVTISANSFAIKFKTKSSYSYLFFSLKDRFLRFHLIDEALLKNKSIMQSNVPFFHTLSKFLTGETLIDFSLLNDDRILAFTFKKSEKIYRVVAEFLPRHPNCYLMDAFQEIKASLYPVDHRIYDLPKEAPYKGETEAHVDQSVNLLDSKAVAKFYAEIEEKNAYSSRKQEMEADLRKQSQRASKRAEQRRERLKECSLWNQMHHNAMLLQSNLYQIKPGMKEIVVADWDQNNAERTIDLDPLVAPHAQIALFFKKSKKLKAGVPHAEKQLILAETEVFKIQKLQKKLEDVKTIEQLDHFFHSGDVKLKSLEKPLVVKPKPAMPYHVFKSLTGKEIWVGKSAKDNDKLTFQCARGLDYWLHARDFPGSHVVIPAERDQELDNETLSDAAELAIRFSKAKGQSVAEVTLTNVKGLVSVKGCPGKVMLSKYKTVRIKLDDKRFSRLRESKATG